MASAYCVGQFRIKSLDSLTFKGVAKETEPPKSTGKEKPGK